MQFVPNGYAKTDNGLNFVKNTTIEIKITCKSVDHDETFCTGLSEFYKSCGLKGNISSRVDLT